MKPPTKKRIKEVFDSFAYSPCRWTQDYISCATTNPFGLMQALMSMEVAFHAEIAANFTGCISVDYNKVINYFNYKQQQS